MSNKLSSVLNRAKRIINQYPRYGLTLPRDQVTQILEKQKTLLVNDRLLDTRCFLLQDSEQAYGSITLSEGKPISLSEFRRRVSEHQISDDLRKARWPKNRRLYAYRIEQLDLLDHPRSRVQTKAGPSDQYAPIHPGSTGEFSEIIFEELTDALHEEFLIRSPFIYAVGSICNNGKTKNDIDLLIRGPLDEATAHIVKFRLGRMLPKELSDRLQFHGGSDDDAMSLASGPFTAHAPLYDLVVRRRHDWREIVEMSQKQQQAIKLPPKDTSKKASFQAHYRGQSVHGDLRIPNNGALIGWTLAIQKAGKVPEFKNLQEAVRLTRSFDKEGSSWNKSLVIPSRIFADPKAEEPAEWANITAEAFEPGTVGATANKWGYIVEIARPMVTYGIQEPYYSEYFLEKDPKLSGLLSFRLLVSDRPATEEELDSGVRTREGEPFWVGAFTKSLLPAILKPRSVQTQREIPRGFSFLPPGLKRVVPQEFRYWEPTDGKERQQLRDELVKSKFFTEDNVKLVGNEFKRVVGKFYYFVQDAPEPLAKRVGAQLWGSTAGKSHIATRLIRLFPEFSRYVEPFAGGGACLFAQERASEEEVVNDLDPEVAFAYKFMRDATDAQLSTLRKKNWTGSRAQFAKLASSKPKNDIDRFYKFAYMTTFAFMRNRHRKTAVDPSRMGKRSTIPDRLEKNRERLKGIKVFNKDYREVLKEFDGKQTFFFLDPPYAEADAEVGEDKFDYDGFFDAIRGLKGKFLVTCDRLPANKEGLCIRKMQHTAARGHHGGAKDYATILVANYELPRKIGKQEQQPQDEELVSASEKAQFTLSWQWWKGQTVVRAAPSKEVFHLFVRRAPDTVEDYQLLADPVSAESIAVIPETVKHKDAEKLLSFEGDVEPGQKLAGVDLNPEKDTPSVIRILHKGTINFLEDGRGFKKFEFEAEDLPKALQGQFVLRPEKDQDDIWIFERSGLPGEELRKSEEIKEVTFSNGEKLEMQVWDPANIRPDDDKTHDRERLQPLALYQPMKAPARDSNEFRSNELDRLLRKFATDKMLAVGISVEPKYNGFRISAQKDKHGKVLLLTEGMFDRRTPPVNLLDALPGLEKELARLPGPYILDGEFMAVDGNGDPVSRRELAHYRSKEPVDDKAVRLKFFDILYGPKLGNVVARPYSERRSILLAMLKPFNFSRAEIAPQRIVKTQAALKEAFEWARKQWGSEGAMLKSQEHTVSLRENDLIAKVKAIREIKGIVWAADPVKDSPGVYTYFYAVGPIPKSEASDWQEPVEVKGKLYVKAGKTFNSKEKAGVGDVLRIEVTELLLDISKEKARLRGFTPTVVGTASSPSTIEEIERLLDDSEIKEPAAKSAFDVEIVSKKEDERYVLGVVLVPEEFDSQGDIYDSNEVEKACHFFMENSPQIGLQHQTTLSDSKVKILECYLAPVDMTVEKQSVKKGTWLMAARIIDDDLWAAVKKGTITGWSIEGPAIVEFLD